eukprot:Sspe_Gene.1111::Locus_374_Transcript_54_54_Confidence_0.149_Length_2469::g.1111::m.1111
MLFEMGGGFFPFLSIRVSPKGGAGGGGCVKSGPEGGRGGSQTREWELQSLQSLQPLQPLPAARQPQRAPDPPLPPEPLHRSPSPVPTPPVTTPPQQISAPVSTPGTVPVKPKMKQSARGRGASSPFSIASQLTRQPPDPSSWHTPDPSLKPFSYLGYIQQLRAAGGSPPLSATVRAYMVEVVPGTFRFDSGVYALQVVLDDGSARMQAALSSALVERFMGVPAPSLVALQTSDPAKWQECTVAFQQRLEFLGPQTFTVRNLRSEAPEVVGYSPWSERDLRDMDHRVSQFDGCDNPLYHELQQLVRLRAGQQS